MKFRDLSNPYRPRIGITWQCPNCRKNHTTYYPIDRCGHSCIRCETVVTWQWILRQVDKRFNHDNLG